MKRDGYVAITVVLILGALIVIIGVSTSLLSISNAQIALSSKKSAESLDLTEACTEEVLRKIRSNASYTTTQVLLPEGSCDIQMSSVGTTYDIQVTHNGEFSIKILNINVTRSPTGMVINSWQEDT